MPETKKVSPLVRHKSTTIDIVGNDLARLQEGLKSISEACLKLVDGITYNGQRALDDNEALLVRMAQYGQIKAIITDALPFYLANGRDEFIRFINDNVLNTVIEA